ncbi:hypothetical protein [Limnoglobus roseus]|uniref:Uncharacterized protein n=1 Tax=Limnoglobus roseus TaxID=2598579 RepID=A0A5C1A9U3_9BACT|nr:hypothetical protein [Limnoglobus roseus]QEL15971.1 hypothetical protein PX52LOC_02908 [Limnoglobus roseus]
MNEFMVLVERAVRPVQAGPKRKLRMREELLAHLTGIHEEELARLGDDSAARAAAVQRFGDPAALTVELQQSVSFSDRMDARMDRAFGWRPGESATRHSARQAGLIALVILPWLPFVLLVAGTGQPDDEPVPSTATLLRFFGGLLVFVPALVFALSVLYFRMRDSLHGAFGAPRSWRRVIGFGALSLLVLPVLGTAFSLISMGATSEIPEESTTARSIAGLFVGFLIVPLFLAGLAWKLGGSEIRHAEWASLDIGQ